jgi:hypothetical protein
MNSNLDFHRSEVKDYVELMLEDKHSVTSSKLM